METFIYALVDPTTEAVRYIGKSNNPKGRIKSHLRDDSRNRKSNWIRSLKKQGLKPSLEIIDKVLKSDWQFWEMHYISLYKSWGFKLTNGTKGGDGVDCGGHLTEDQKEHLRKINTGKKMSPEAIEKTAQANRGRKNSEATKKVISDKLKGRKRDPEAIRKMAETNYKPILQYDLIGSFIREFKSIKEATLEVRPNNRGLTDCLKGSRKTWCGFKWEYK